MRARPLTNVVELVLAIGSPYIPLIALTGLALAALARQKILSALAVVVLTATLSVQLPWYYSAQPLAIGDHAEIRVLSSNLRLGQADPLSFVTLATQSADVITVSELTPSAVERFDRAGLGDVFPYSANIPAHGAGGIGLWSRYPITVVPPGRPEYYGISAVRIDVPGVRFHPLVASVHVMSPVASRRDTVTDWRIGIAAVKVAINALAVGAGPAAMIVAGDFNSTPDQRQFRDLMTNGFRDSVEQSGAGFSPTFPSRTWHPPLLTIDHILTRNAAASSIRTIYIPGSDHRALLATIEVPVDPTAS
ncbi:MAG: endonuclease/exonuclease/phosphatase family protein [Mycobacterium sp.]